MTDRPLTSADESAHRAEPHPDWEEWWYFDFAHPDASVAGYARLALRPGDGVAWWWSAVVGRDLPFVLVRDHEVPLPRAGTLEVRSTGLWTGPVCETPFDHWSLGLEAFGVGLADPLDAYGDERGDLVPLGFDLEWEATEPPGTLAGDRLTAYEQRCTVHGDVLVGSERLGVDGSGRREHGWGRRDWSQPDRAAAPAVDDRGLITGVEVVAHAPLQVPPSRLARALCRVGGELVWLEKLQPASMAMG